MLRGMKRGMKRGKARSQQRKEGQSSGHSPGLWGICDCAHPSPLQALPLLLGCFSFLELLDTLPLCPTPPALILQEELVAEGVDEGDIFPISAVTGQGVLPLVRRVRQVLEQLGPAEQVSTHCDTAQIGKVVGKEAQNSGCKVGLHEVRSCSAHGP